MKEGWDFYIERMHIVVANFECVPSRRIGLKRTCGAGKQTRRMPSGLACRLEYLGSGSAGCMPRCCFPLIAIIFVAHLAGKWPWHRGRCGCVPRGFHCGLFPLAVSPIPPSPRPRHHQRLYSTYKLGSAGRLLAERKCICTQLQFA